MPKSPEVRSPAHITGVPTNEYRRDVKPSYISNGRGASLRPKGKR
jgi:hypothetical protein